VREPADGNSISTTDGSWDTHGCTTTYTYNWSRENFAVADAVDATYDTDASDDSGLAVHATVVATNGYGTITADSNAVQVPFAPDPNCTTTAPLSTAAPAISGQPYPDGWVAVSTGDWSSCSSSIAGYSFQWFRDGVAITGATDQSYLPVANDTGANLTASVVAYNHSGPSLAIASAGVGVGATPTQDIGTDGGPTAVSGDPICFGSLAPTTPCDPSHPGHNYGGMVVQHSTTPDIRGVRSAIMTPTRHDFVLPSVTAGIMRVSAESGDATGLIQVGFARTWSQYIDDCGPGVQDGKLYTMFEWIKRDPINPQIEFAHCEWGTQLNRGSSKLYTVFRKKNTAAPNTWEARINGAYVVSQPLDFEAAGTAVAGGEIVSSSGTTSTFARPDGTLYGCYGCKASALGLIPWQTTTRAGSSAWKKVTSADAVEITADHFPTDGRWSVDGFPTAWYVLHFCLPDHSRGC
jgi:hypothetical protein